MICKEGGCHLNEAGTHAGVQCGCKCHVHRGKSDGGNSVSDAACANCARLEFEKQTIKSELKSRVYLHNTLSEWVVKARDREATLEKDLMEQCRLLGISGSTEAKLLAEKEELKKERDRYKAALQSIAMAPTQTAYSTSDGNNLNECVRIAKEALTTRETK